MNKKMRADILDQNKKNLGTLYFNRGRNPILEDGADDELKSFIDMSLKQGIKQRKEVWKKDRRLIYEIGVSQDDANYPLIFLEWLRGHGYRVEVLRPEVDEKIGELLEKMPKDHSIFKKTKKGLEGMTYLKKTFILEALRKVVNKK